ncbi:uncharacterized protein LOC143585999 [Bidens hawaiensis]|uniref:uncharacterized protein LOC143585999 n=1 Tax=Bidens hawaiensis TaxID=980011 RepID=UPI00404B0D2F
MALPETIFHPVSSIKICAALIQHLRMWSMGSTKDKKKIMLKFKFKNYCLFESVVDMEIQEFGDRLMRLTQFDVSKLMRLCEFCPHDFDNGDKFVHASQLGLYIDSVRKDERFANLKGIADLARVMVETTKHISFHLAYGLLKLTLILHIATATVKRCVRQ